MYCKLISFQTNLTPDLLRTPSFLYICSGILSPFQLPGEKKEKKEKKASPSFLLISLQKLLQFSTMGCTVFRRGVLFLGSPFCLAGSASRIALSSAF